MAGWMGMSQPERDRSSSVECEWQGANWAELRRPVFRRAGQHASATKERCPSSCISSWKDCGRPEAGPPPELSVAQRCACVCVCRAALVRCVPPPASSGVWSSVPPPTPSPHPRASSLPSRSAAAAGASRVRPPPPSFEVSSTRLSGGAAWGERAVSGPQARAPRRVPLRGASARGSAHVALRRSPRPRLSAAHQAKPSRGLQVRVARHRQRLARSARRGIKNPKPRPTGSGAGVPSNKKNERKKCADIRPPNPAPSNRRHEQEALRRHRSAARCAPAKENPPPQETLRGRATACPPDVCLKGTAAPRFN